MPRKRGPKDFKSWLHDTENLGKDDSLTTTAHRSGDYQNGSIKLHRLSQRVTGQFCQQTQSLGHHPGAQRSRENLPHSSRYRYGPARSDLIPGPSTDGTADVAREIMPSIRIIDQEGKGKGAALRSGVIAATGDILASSRPMARDLPARSWPLLARCSTKFDLRQRLALPARRWHRGHAAVPPTRQRRTHRAHQYAVRHPLQRHYLWLQRHLAQACPLARPRDQRLGLRDRQQHPRAARDGLRGRVRRASSTTASPGEAKLATFNAGWSILKAILAEAAVRRDRNKKAKITAPKATPSSIGTVGCMEIGDER